LTYKNIKLFVVSLLWFCKKKKTTFVCCRRFLCSHARALHTPIGQAPRRFTQTFFLAAQQPSGYYVLNDIFRYLKHDASAPRAAPNAAAPPVVRAAPPAQQQQQPAQQQQSAPAQQPAQQQPAKQQQQQPKKQQQPAKQAAPAATPTSNGVTGTSKPHLLSSSSSL
jgi:hypothetical protein